MSEDENNLEVEKSIKIKEKNSDREATLKGDSNSIDIAKEIFTQAQQLAEDNKRLNEKLQKYESTAPLNNAQLTGETIHLDDQSEMPVDMQQYDSELDLINSLEKQAKDGNNEAKKALNDLLVKSTKTSWTYDFNGDPKDLYRKPKDEADRKKLNESRRMWSRV